MKKINELIHISKLISRKISGDQTKELEEKFNFWKNSSKENQILFEKIKDQDNLQERNNTINSINIEDSWLHFLAKLDKKSGRTRFLSFIKLAAAVLVPIAVAGFLYLYINIDNQQIVKMEPVISPGERGALLIMNDGSSIDLKGLDSVELKEKDGTVINKVNDELHYETEKLVARKSKQLLNTIIISKGEEYSLFLSDSTKVFINSMSKLKFPVQFIGDQREVTLLEGEAYFEVTKDPERPFIVNLNGMKVEVLGTSFNIKAYSDENNIYTTLVEGKVKINVEYEGSEETILLPDHQVVLDKTNKNIIVNKVDAKQFTQWRNGIYSFSDRPLGEIMHTLSRWYDFEYEFSSDSLKNICFEGGLNKYEDITPILEIIQSTGKISANITDNKILFMDIK